MAATLRCAVLAFTLLGASGVARALPTLPKKLQEATSAACLPRCSLCHRDENAGKHTVDRPFGVSFVAAGGDSQLSAAVTRFEEVWTDSDGDGTADLDELRMGSDPNSAYDASLCGPEVGCSSAPPTAQRGTLPLLAFGLLLAGALRRARRAGTRARRLN